MKKKKQIQNSYNKIRKPTAPPTEAHGKNKYDRKEKHKKDYE